MDLLLLLITYYNAIDMYVSIYIQHKIIILYMFITFQRGHSHGSPQRTLKGFTLFITALVRLILRELAYAHYRTYFVGDYNE